MLIKTESINNNNKNVRFSAILPPNSGYTTEMAFLISMHLSTEITPLSSILSALSACFFEKSEYYEYDCGNNTVSKHTCKHQVLGKKRKSFVMIQMILFLVVLAEAAQAVIREMWLDVMWAVSLQT